jgi:hypothetical protein
MKWLILLLAPALLCNAESVRITETAGIARQHEPVTVKMGGEDRVLFVTIGANESRVFEAADLKPRQPIRYEQTDRVGFRLDTGALTADHSSQVYNGKAEDSGSLRILGFPAAGVVLQRITNRMHWAPSFQRAGARGYTSIATWDPVQSHMVRQMPGVVIATREGRHQLYPEIGLWSEYRYFAGAPYFLFHAVTTIKQEIEMFWLRGQEMTMENYFTHAAWPEAAPEPGSVARIVRFEERKPLLEKLPLPAGTPWIAFVNPERGFGFGAVVLEYKATTTANAMTAINDGARDGKYWDRHLIGRVNTRLKPGDRYEERTAYVLFRASPGAPLAEFLAWEKKLRNPLKAEPVR